MNERPLHACLIVYLNFQYFFSQTGFGTGVEVECEVYNLKMCL